MSTNLLAATADAAARSVASMFVVLAAGVVFAYTGKLDTEGLQAIGVTINWLFVPAILFDSFGAGLSWEAMKNLWVVAVLGVVALPLSAIISYPSMMLSKPPDWFRPWFLFGATFQNTVALPLVLIQTICSQIRVPQRTDAGAIITDGNGTTLWMTQSQCSTRGELYIFMYIFIHSLLFWVVAYDLMPNKNAAKANEGTDEKDVEDGEGNIVSQVPKSSEEPADLLINDSVAETNEQPSSRNLLHNSGSTTETTEPISVASMVQLNGSRIDDDKPSSESREALSLYKSKGLSAPGLRPSFREKRLERLARLGNYMAGSFYGGVEQIEVVRQVGEQNIEKKPKTFLRKVKAKSLWLFFHILSLCARPPIIAQLLGMFIGLIRPLQEAFFSPTSVLRPLTLSIKIFAVASTAVTNLSMGGGLGLKMKEVRPRHLCGGDPDGLSRRATLGFVCTRMLIIPAVLFGSTYLLQISNLIPNDRLLLLVLYMQTMTPSANMCVVVPQILGDHQAGGALSLLVLSQYAVALPTMLVWLSLAFYVTADIP